MRGNSPSDELCSAREMAERWDDEYKGKNGKKKRERGGWRNGTPFEFPYTTSRDTGEGFVAPSPGKNSGTH